MDKTDGNGFDLLISHRLPKDTLYSPTAVDQEWLENFLFSVVVDDDQRLLKNLVTY